MSFSNYVDWLSDPETPTTPNFRPHAQVSDWFVDEHGKIAVQYLLRQEKLQDDLRDLSSLTGIQLKIPSKRVNTSNHKPWYQFYSSADVDKITALHPRDIKLFGYSYEDGTPVDQRLCQRAIA